MKSEHKYLADRLRNDGTAIGSWVSTVSPSVAELMARSGFDYLTIDAEHSPVDFQQIQQLLQAISAGNPACAGLVRVPGRGYDEIKRYMDAGAQGVIVPLVTHEDEAREIVRAVKYPPQGERGVGFCRDNDYGASLTEWLPHANDETFVCVQIEHADAVQRIDAILGVDGIDAAFIGPYDLSASLGCTADFDHPEFLAAKRTVLDACIRHNVTPGIHVVQPDPEQMGQAHREGYRLLAYSLDITMLNVACREGLRASRDRIGSSEV